ncbi:hypothetical protein [Sphingomonas sp.]|uniref:hypothetical protein n=1 Tax=Sphingomonas sp. TaxID=28214 RepID=UPI0028A68CF6|nr:hypothetical protein [Sphingomonas sp.]
MRYTTLGNIVIPCHSERDTGHEDCLFSSAHRSALAQDVRSLIDIKTISFETWERVGSKQPSS